jgi:hypothetical protein
MRCGLTSSVHLVMSLPSPILCSPFPRAYAPSTSYSSKQGIENYTPVYLSALAAILYLIATLGFAYRRKWTWWLSVISLGFETIMTLLIGVWSFVDPDLIGRTVWRHFGEDYGYFPLFQPMIGLVWLLWPLTMEAYGIRSDSQAPRPDKNSA